ncbi:TonB-dependent receptor [Undibacterium sp. RuTC16W]|uniref:TonB-dependent receptor n=1 Tax=Undibacterium sp. RuTC16W TaxID=3413048 RepID=UPI003BF18096
MSQENFSDVVVMMTRKSQYRFSLKRTATSLAVSSLFCAPVFAQETPVQTDTVVVTGIKASLSKAQNIKRNAEQIVDAIVADDIGKLPDSNVAEALQRITGVQISRNRGEGDRVQIRGLSQTQTLFNGRSIFTAGKERGLSFQDVPAELLAGADVYKTPTADQVEGGIGGVIDLRTRRPFDFSGYKVAATLKATEADFAKKDNIEGSVLLSNRWNTDIGEFGALLSVSKQKRNYRSDTQELGAPAQLADGSGIYAPTGSWTAYELGSRDRTGVSATLQYRPSKEFEFYLDTAYTELKTKTDTYGFFASPFWANYNASTNSGQLWPKGAVTAPNNLFQSGTFWGASMSTSGYIGDNETTTSQLALGGSWKSGNWKIKSELSHTNSDFSRLYQEVRLGTWTNNPAFTFDLGTATPSAYPVLGNASDLTTPSQYWADKGLYFRQKNDGHETVWRLDAEKGIDTAFITRLRGGLRLSDRTAASAEINTINDIFSSSATGAVAGASTGLATQIGVIPYNNLLSGAGAGVFPKQWLSVMNLDWLRDPATSRAALGLSVPGFDAAQTFDYSEKTRAAYGVADFESNFLGKNLTGNLGLRLVNTRSQRSYNQVSGSVVTAQTKSRDENDLLPSLNVRMDLSDKLVARIAASKVVTRPNFDQLTPSLSLNANDKTGYIGNPDLGTLSANQFDTSLEYYISDSDHVYGAAFYKKVDGFIQTSMQSLVYGGSTYNVNTPRNGDNGQIQGMELGYQGFFTHLPGVFKGLGLQANYTLVESSAPGPLGGQKTQLEGLSKNSYNLIGMYDDQKLSLRLAYNYRDNYIAGTQNYYTSNGAKIAQTPVYMKAYGMLDAYISYAISKNLKLAFEANNLTKTVRRSYYSIDNMPRGVYVDDRRFALSLHLDM